MDDYSPAKNLMTMCFTYYYMGKIWTPLGHARFFGAWRHFISSSAEDLTVDHSGTQTAESTSLHTLYKH